MRRILILIALASALACKGKDNTKIVVAVWSDLAVPADIDNIRIDVPGTGSKNLSLTASSQSGQTSLVAELELVPLGAKNETFTVTATGLHAGNDVVAQTAIVSFVAGQSLLLKLFLSGNCMGAKCNANYTCSAGTCQPVSVPNLPPYDPSTPLSPPDAGVAIDSGSTALDGGSAIDGGTLEAGSAGLRAVDARSLDSGRDAMYDLPVSTGAGGAGGASGLGDASGSGGAVGSDAGQVDASLADAVDAPLGSTGGAGGSSGTGGASGLGGASGAGGFVGSDAGQVDASVAGAADAPLGSTGGAPGTSGTGGSSGMGGTSGAGGAGGTVASGGVVVSGGIVGTGGAGTGGTTAACQEDATQCSGNSVKTCTNGQWATAVACGVRQTCTGPLGTAKCTCNVDPVCSSVGNTCSSGSTLATCAQDAEACFYQASATTCTNGSCTGGSGSASCCTNACTVGTTQCLSGTSLQTCAVGTNGCAAYTTSTCTNGACAGVVGSASCCTNACTVGATQCLSSTSLQTCAVGANGCTAYAASTCTNGACTGASGSASCCTNACTVGTTCLSSTSLQTCAVGANGCTSATTTACTCAGAAGSASCVAWAEWPMPNDQVDVTAGAPNLESYTDNKDGTVTDNVTGLMWQQAVSTTTYTWAQAVAYCPTLILAGHSDWRLPSRIELVSIVDFGARSGEVNSDAAINATYFPSTPSSLFWSSSPLAGSSSYAWSVYFNYGYASYGGVSSAVLVRCVR